MEALPNVGGRQIPGSWSCALSGSRLVEGPVARIAAPPGEARVVVSVLVAGICRSDIKELIGQRHALTTFGHELVGRVESIEGASAPCVGSRVILNPMIPIRRTTGFATHLVASGDPSAIAAAFTSVPDVIDVDRLVFTEPLACAVHATNKFQGFLRRSCGEGKNSIAVLGAGLFGLLIACVLRRGGASVILANRSAGRFASIRQFSIDEGVELKLFSELEPDVVDAAIVASTLVTPEIIELAASVTRRGGLIHVFAGTRPGDRYGCPPLDVDHLRRHEELHKVPGSEKGHFMSGSHGAPPDAYVTAGNLLTSDRAPLAAERLVTGRVALPAVAERLPELAREGWSGRILVDPVLPPSTCEQNRTHVALCFKDGETRLQSIQTRLRGDGVILAPITVGLCGTDRQLVDGSRPDRASVLGHEALCRVEAATGSAHREIGIGVGSHVVLNPVDPERPNEVFGHSIDGALQSQLFVDDRMIRLGVLVPYHGTDCVLATLAEPLAAALYGLDTVESVSGRLERIAVMGAGPAGVLVALAAVIEGASHVRIFSENQRRLDFIHNSAILPRENLVQITGIEASYRGQFDAVFHCGSRRQTHPILTKALTLLRPGGVLDLFAGVDPSAVPSPYDAARIAAARAGNVCGREASPLSVPIHLNGGIIRVTGHRGTSPRQLVRALAMLEANPAIFRHVVTHVIGLSEAAWLLNTWARGGHDPSKDARLKVVVNVGAARQ
jgi:threonine dehydrogenase-like Zn-dependent dehydrogenase